MSATAAAGTERPVMTGIEVIYLYVADIRRSVAFYEAGFGVSFVTRGDDWAECTLGDGVRFAFHLADPDAPPPTSGTLVVDLRVDDLDATRGRLAELGATITETQEAPSGCFFGFIDPDGYRLQVFARRSR
ncbi:MAG TPA: VOC family protein [Candidatus Limnocylindria bacterium]